MALFNVSNVLKSLKFDTAAESAEYMPGMIYVSNAIAATRASAQKFHQRDAEEVFQIQKMRFDSEGQPICRDFECQQNEIMHECVKPFFDFDSPPYASREAQEADRRFYILSCYSFVKELLASANFIEPKIMLFEGGGLKYEKYMYAEKMKWNEAHPNEPFKPKPKGYVNSVRIIVNKIGYFKNVIELGEMLQAKELKKSHPFLAANLDIGVYEKIAGMMRLPYQMKNEYDRRYMKRVHIEERDDGKLELGKTMKTIDEALEYDIAYNCEYLISYVHGMGPYTEYRKTPEQIEREKQMKYVVMPKPQNLLLQTAVEEVIEEKKQEMKQEKKKEKKEKETNEEPKPEAKKTEEKRKPGRPKKEKKTEETKKEADDEDDEDKAHDKYMSDLTPSDIEYVAERAYGDKLRDRNVWIRFCMMCFNHLRLKTVQGTLAYEGEDTDIVEMCARVSGRKADGNHIRGYTDHGFTEFWSQARARPDEHMNVKPGSMLADWKKADPSAYQAWQDSRKKANKAEPVFDDRDRNWGTRSADEIARYKAMRTHIVRTAFDDNVTDVSCSILFEMYFKDRAYVEEEQGFVYNSEKRLWDAMPAKRISKCISDPEKDPLKCVTEVENAMQKKARKDEFKKTLKKPLKAIADLRKRLQSSLHCRHMYEFVEHRMYRDNVCLLFNRNHHLLPIEGGLIINLKTLEVRDRTKDDMFTTECPVQFIDPKTWTKEDEKEMEFVRKSFAENEEYIGYSQMKLGSSLCGDLLSRKFTHLFGLGSNGKTLFMLAIASMLGKFAQRIKREALIITGSTPSANAHTAHLQALIETRMVYGEELEEDDILYASFVKDIVNELPTVRFRAPHGLKEYTVALFCKLFICSNFSLKFRAKDGALIDRYEGDFYPGRFLNPEDKAKEMKKKNKKADVKIYDKDTELMGKLTTKTRLRDLLFTWLAIGCSKWYANIKKGLKKPDIVVRHYKEALAEANLTAKWARDECEVDDEDFEEAGTTMHTNYLSWCRRNRIEEKKVLGYTDFNLELVNLGYEKIEKRRVVYFRGIRIYQEPTEEEEEVVSRAEFYRGLSNGEIQVRLFGESDNEETDEDE